MELRSGNVASSAASTPPQEGDKMSSAPTEPTTLPGPTILSPQVTASEAWRIIDTEDVEDTELSATADTLISLRAPPSYLPPPLPVQPPPANSAFYPAGTGPNLDLTLVCYLRNYSLTVMISHAAKLFLLVTVVSFVIINALDLSSS